MTSYTMCAQWVCDCAKEFEGYDLRGNKNPQMKGVKEDGNQDELSYWGKYVKRLKLLQTFRSCRHGAVVKGVEHISTIVLVNICVARVRVPLVLSVGI